MFRASRSGDDASSRVLNSLQLVKIRGRRAVKHRTINCSFPKTQSPIAKLSMYYKSAYHHAQHFPKSNRYLTYVHFSETSHGSARRRVNGQIAGYFHELIVLSQKLSDPSQNYLCVANVHTTMHNTSQNLIDISHTSTSQRRLKEVLAAV